MFISPVIGDLLFDGYEITTYKPIFNMRHNPQPISFIQNARNCCKKIAAGQITIN